MKPNDAPDGAPPRSSLRVGFVGLGRMGLPMTGRLARAGFAVTGFDLDAGACERFRTAGQGRIADSVGELGRDSDVVITMLPNGDAVRAVVLGAAPRGSSAPALLDVLAPGAIVVDCSSSAPTGTRDLGEILAAKSIGMLDAPVSGGVAGAEAGTLAIMVGGEPQLLERCRPLLAAIGTRIFACGPLGAGHAPEGAQQSGLGSGLFAAAEALLIGRRFGLEPSVMVDVFNASTARNNSTENKFKQFVLSRRFSSGFSLALMVKDLGTALDLAAATSTPAPLAARCRELWSTAGEELEDDADHTAVVRWLEMLTGTTLDAGT
jgi:3-hydroxyisobutyrate dehydrogenase